MLIAVIRGKAGRERKDREDMITSAVFGQLKHLPPQVFWPTVLAKSKCCEYGTSLKEFTSERGIDVERYDSLEIKFWPRQGRVEPDMIIRFTGSRQPDFQMITEVKLRCLRGVRGRKDQLASYMRLMRTGSRKTVTAFVYLTPNESRYHDDLEDAFTADPRLNRYRSQAFRLFWPDLSAAVEEECQRKLVHPYNSLLADLDVFLKQTVMSTELASSRRYSTSKPSPLANDLLGSFVIDVC